MFKKLFGDKKSEEVPQIDRSRFSRVDKAELSDFQDLVEQHAGLSFEKQLVFADVIGSSGWELDMGQGGIFFGDLAFPIQIIGSLSFANNSWMWGWANTQSGMPEQLLVQSHKLKEIGEQKNIQELTEGHFDVAQGFEHKMGMMACGFFNAKSYYCANYGQGTLVVTIDDPKIPEIDKNRFERVLTSFPQLIGGVDLNHKNAFQNYLIDRDFELCLSSNKIEGLKSDTILTAEFDELNRLKSLNGSL